MTEQDHLITDDNWQKRKCSKCCEWKYATGVGNEHRQWQGNVCPDCRLADTRRQRRARTLDSSDPRFHGAYAVSKIFRSRNDLMPEAVKAVCDPIKRQWQAKRKKYGIDKWRWLLMYHAQQGKCAICKVAPLTSSRDTDIDHDHQTGKVRGLLCHACNLRMAAIDDTDWKAKAEAYKERTR